MICNEVYILNTTVRRRILSLYAVMIYVKYYVRVLNIGGETEQHQEITRPDFRPEQASPLQRERERERCNVFGVCIRSAALKILKSSTRSYYCTDDDSSSSSITDCTGINRLKFSQARRTIKDLNFVHSFLCFDF